MGNTNGGIPNSLAEVCQGTEKKTELFAQNLNKAGMLEQEVVGGGPVNAYIA